MSETNLRVGKGIHSNHPADWGWEVSSEQMGYAWGTADSEVDAFRDAAIKLNEVIASKGFEAQSNETEHHDEVEQLKTSIRAVLDGENILDFENYEAFEDWLDTTMEYDRRDNEDTPGGNDIGSEDNLRQVYLELCSEARAGANSKPGMRMG